MPAWAIRLLFGFPMKIERKAFLDNVSGKQLYYCVDQRGFRYIALDRWDWTRHRLTRDNRGTL